jgi:hypothetical protein
MDRKLLPGPLPRHGISSEFLTGGMMHIGHPIQFIEKCRNFGFEFREVIYDDIPDDLPVYLEISMDHLVPHAGNLPLCDIGMPLLERCGNALDGLTYTSIARITACA